MASLNQLLDDKVVKILLVLSKHKSKFYHITQLAQDAKVPTATTFRIIRQLLKAGTITMSKVGKFKIYKYNDTEDNNKIMGLLANE